MFVIADAALGFRDGKLSQNQAIEMIISRGISKETALTYLKAAMNWPKPGYGSLDEKNNPVKQISVSRYLRENS